MKSISQRGYTMVEILVTIAIITIMTAIFVGSYSFGKNFDTLKAETQRLSAVLRNARIRDFNGIVQRVKICTGSGITFCTTQGTECTSPETCDASADLYPPGGFGIHINTNYRVCDDKPQISCYDDADCPSGACGGSGTGRTNYILFADISNNGLYDGGKSGNEYISEYKVPANLTMELQGTVPLSQATIVFKGSTVTVYDTNGPRQVSDESLYLKGCTNQTRNQKGRVNISSSSPTTSILDELMPCT